MRDIEVESASTDELVDLARRQVAAWADAARALVPENAVSIDAHCHIGTDSDGSHMPPEQLIAQLDAAGMRGAMVTPLHHVEGYAAENAAVRDVCLSSGGRLHALHRCDPRVTDIAADVTAGLDAGAVGLKWHPRGEKFGMTDTIATKSAAAAGDAGVPILIHAGRGMGLLGEGVVALARANPKATFILAHAAISDLAWILEATADLPNIVFDTSWWRPTDVAVLLASAPPERVLFGTDPPYGTVSMGLQITTRLARACGWDDDSMRALMGGNAARIFERAALGPVATEADVASRSHHMPVELPAFRRAAEYLAASIQIEFAGGDSLETFDLAQCALAIPSDDPNARRASLLAGAMRVGQAIVTRDSADAAAEPGEPEADPSGPSKLRQVGIELLVCTLAHVATPTLPSPGIERSGWDT